MRFDSTSREARDDAPPRDGHPRAVARDPGDKGHDARGQLDDQDGDPAALKSGIGLGLSLMPTAIVKAFTSASLLSRAPSRGPGRRGRVAT